MVERSRCVQDLTSLMASSTGTISLLYRETTSTIGCTSISPESRLLVVEAGVALRLV